MDKIIPVITKPVTKNNDDERPRPTAGQLDLRIERLGVGCVQALVLSLVAYLYTSATGPWPWDGWPRLLTVWALGLAGFLYWRLWAAMAERRERGGG